MGPCVVTLSAPFTTCEELRRATRSLHDEAERTPLMARLFGGQVDMVDYVELLLRLLSFHQAFEPELAAPTSAPQLRVRAPRVPLLLADLRELRAGTRAPFTVQIDRRELADPSWRAGALYVIEGSSLGGKVIARQLEQRLGRSVRDALSYYRVYGSDVGRIWRDMRHTINAATLDRKQAIAGAVATFEAFLEAMVVPERAPRPSPQPACPIGPALGSLA